MEDRKKIDLVINTNFKTCNPILILKAMKAIRG